MSLFKCSILCPAASTDTFVGFQNDYIVRLSSPSGCQTRRRTQPGPSSTNHHDIHLAWVVHTRAFAVLRMNVSNGSAATVEQVINRANDTNNREKEMDTMMILVLTNESNSRAANAL
jgi:hypothetical protein